MKKQFIAWLLGMFTWAAVIVFSTNTAGRSLLEIVGLFIIITIINLAAFAVWYIDDNTGGTT